MEARQITSMLITSPSCLQLLSSPPYTTRSTSFVVSSVHVVLKTVWVPNLELNPKQAMNGLAP